MTALNGKMAIITGGARGVAKDGIAACVDYATQIWKDSARRASDCEKDVGAFAVFLASDAAGYISGRTLMVDGGRTKAFQAPTRD